MKVLFAASEIFPYAKTGGLADVAYALPLALKKYVDIARVMPLYSFMAREALCFYDNFTITLDGDNYALKIWQHEEKGIITYFIEAPYLSQTDSLYGDSLADYKENALRFTIFCMAIVELSMRLNITLIHLNDWHTALVAFFVKKYDLTTKTLFTMHNLAYQGIFDRAVLKILGIEEHYFTMDALEFHGKVNFLKAGIAFSDCITTVSMTYAQEILTETFGCGLHGFLEVHKKKLFGILNGIDYGMFPPLKEIGDKKTAKELLYKKFQFVKKELPLFVMISRLVEQKGLELLIESLDLLLSQNLYLFILGKGELEYVKVLKKYARLYENFYFFEAYDEALSHQIYLAADFLLMPSTFEPCGLNQFIAMKNGTIPVVHEVGGLKESVHEIKALCGRGISYTEQNKQEFLYALKRAQDLYEDQERLKHYQHFNLQCDFSFNKSAQRYLELYRSLV